MDQEYENRKKFSPFRKTARFYRGIAFTFKNDLSVIVQTIISVITIAVSLIFRESVDVLLVIIVSGLMLSMEFMNTAVERVCDFIQPEYDESIKIIKDVAAAAVGIAVIVWSIVIGWEYFDLVYNYYFT